MANCIYNLEYHVVFVVKYRRNALIDQDLDKSLKILMKIIAKRNDIEIQNMETDKDHIHMLISLKPTHYIPKVIQLLKRASSRYIRNCFPETKSVNSEAFWSLSYFICTVSENSKENIKKYIDNQKKNGILNL